MLWLIKDATYELFVVLETSYLTGASRSFLRAPHQLPNNMYDEVFCCSYLPSIPSQSIGLAVLRKTWGTPGPRETE